MAKNELEDLLTQCIRCGFCLESCPTFQLTGSEVDSPRGRIYLIRSALNDQVDWAQDAGPAMDHCLGCRACETACPSGVQYGHIFELAKNEIASRRGRTVVRPLVNAMTNPQIFKAQTLLSRLTPGKRIPGPISRALSGEPAEVDKPRSQPKARWPELRAADCPPVIGEVYLLEGCAMRVLYPRVHQATRRLLRRIGFTIREIDLGCCGALHAHNGELDAARELAQRLANRMVDPLPIVVNSAGCGSTMKEYGNLDSELDGVAKRTFDLSEFLLSNGMVEVLAKSAGVEAQVTYHDACHLSHGQRVTSPPRQLLAAIPQATIVPLHESDMCCGSAGIYNVMQPKMARQLLERKWGNINATGAEIVVLGNPGCHAWIEQGSRERNGARVLHLAEILEESFSGRA